MIQLWMVQHRHHRMDCARFRIIRPVYQSFEASMNQGACAHGARLNRSEQLAVSHTVVTEVCSSFPKGDDFGVGRRIGLGEVPIPAATDYLAATHDDRAYRNLSCFERPSRCSESLFHQKLVGCGWLSFVAGHRSLTRPL
jgi:hypothetical protein